MSTWASIFEDAFGSASIDSKWTKDPNNGTIALLSGALRMSCVVSTNLSWTSTYKNAPLLVLPFAAIGASAADLLCLEVTLNQLQVGNLRYTDVGLILDDENAHWFMVNESSAGLEGMFARANLIANAYTESGWSAGVASAWPAKVRLYYNGGATAQTIEGSTSLAPGYASAWISYAGAAYVLMETWLVGIAPIGFVLATQNTTGGGNPALDARFDDVSVTKFYTYQPTDETIRGTLMDLYPPGAYPSIDGRGGQTFHYDVCEQDASLLTHARVAVEQLELEIFPQTAEETLDEWEAALQIDTVLTAVADRQGLAADAARSPLLVTPKNLRAMLAELLQSVYGFWDPGTLDVLAHYDVQQGNGYVAEDASGLALGAASPAQCSFDLGNDPHATVRLVDRADGWTLEAELQSAVIGAGSATGIFISPEPLGRLGDALFLGMEHYGGSTAIRALLYTAADGDWSQLGTIATVGPPCWFRIVRGSDGVLQLRAGASLGALANVVSDLALTWTPRVWGVCTRNSGAWATVEGVWQDIRIAYNLLRNNVELHEYRADQIPDGDPERIFWAFVHRDPDDAGAYDLAGAQRICDRVKWGHSQIIVGESDCFLCDDSFSLTDRDILGA